MTSTNDEEVKNSSNLGQKNKTHFIELYKSLETRLASESELRTRTSVLCEAWSNIHSLCSHSSPDTHPLLLGWIQRHTAKTLLLTEWQSPNSTDVRSQFEASLKAFDEEAQKAIAKRNDNNKQFWETQLLQLSNQFKITLADPWGHPVLRLLLDQKGEQPNDEQITRWLLEERGEMFVARLRQLAASKCDDLALSLATAVLDRSRPPTDHEAKDDNDDNSGIPDPGGTNTEFAALLKTEAGFTNDLWDLLYDIEMVLLHKMEKTARCIELAKQIPLRMGYHIVERLRTRLEKSPREKKLWKNSKEVATLVVQVVVARCMVVNVCSGVCRLALYWCSRALVRLVAGEWLHNALTLLTAPAVTARHLHTFATAVEAQSDKNMVPLVCELYVRAITTGMNELERLKLKSEMNAEARLMEKSLSTWFLQLSGVLQNNERVVNECLLTAFSVHPSAEMFARLEAAPELPVLKDPKLEASTSEFSWATDSRATNAIFVKTSETLQLNMTTQQATVLSTAILTEGEKLGLGPELCQDLAVLLGGPRVKTLSWDMDRKELLANCRQYMERTGAGTKTLTTELKYLNLDPAKMQHLREENYENENDVYYGIEKGYEYLLETQQALPEEIWQVAHEKVSGDWSSDSDEVILPSRGRRARRHSSDEDSDPLCLLAELKYGKENFKEKTLRKERSKERSKTHKKRDGSHSKDRRKASKVSEKRKDKSVTDDRSGSEVVNSLSDLIGVKVSYTDPLQESSKKERRNKKKERRRQEKLNKNNALMFNNKGAHENNAGLSTDSIKSQYNQNGYSDYANVNISNPTFNESTNMRPCTPSTSAEIRDNIARLIQYRKIKSDQNLQNNTVRDSLKFNQITQNTSATSSQRSNPPIDYIKKHYPELNMDMGSQINSIDKSHYDHRTILESRATTPYSKHLIDDKTNQQASIRKSHITTKAEVKAFPSQSSNATVKSFIKDLNETINAGAKYADVDKKPKSTISAKNAFSSNPIKHTNQSAKTNTQRKSDSVNTTYSRLNYLHKTKMNEANKSKQASTDTVLTPEQEALLQDLDKELAQFKVIKLKTLTEPDYKPKPPIQTVNNSRLTYDLKKGQRANSQTTCSVRNSRPTKDFNKPRKLNNQQTNKRTMPIVSNQHDKSPLIQGQHLKPTGRLGISQPVTPGVPQPVVPGISQPIVPGISHPVLTGGCNIKKAINNKIIQRTENMSKKEEDHMHIPKQNLTMLNTDFDAIVPESVIANRTVPELCNNNTIGKPPTTKKGGSRKYTKCNKRNQTQPQQDWVSVMNEILAHRTPKRGESALNQAFKKDSDDSGVPLNLTKTTQPVKILPEPLVSKSIQPKSATPKILKTTQISEPKPFSPKILKTTQMSEPKPLSPKILKTTQTSEPKPLSPKILKTTQISKPLSPKISDLTQIRNCNLAKPVSAPIAQITDSKMPTPDVSNLMTIPMKAVHIPEKVNTMLDNQTDKRLPDLAHKVLPEDYIDDVQVEKMINADLLDIREDLADLDCDGFLDDLFDNELLQEISELTSDEETSKDDNDVNIVKRASAKSLIDLFATEQSPPFVKNPIKAKSKKSIETFNDNDFVGMKIQNGHLIVPKTVKSVIVNEEDQPIPKPIPTPMLDPQKELSNITNNIVPEISYVLENETLCNLPHNILPSATHGPALDNISTTIQNKPNIVFSQPAVVPQPTMVRQPDDMVLLLGTRVLYSNYPSLSTAPVSQNLPRNAFITSEVPAVFETEYMPTYNNVADELDFVNSQLSSVNMNSNLNETYGCSLQEQIPITNTFVQTDNVEYAATPAITQNIPDAFCTDAQLQPITQYDIPKTPIPQMITDLSQMHEESTKLETLQTNYHTDDCENLDNLKNTPVNVATSQETFQPVTTDQCLKDAVSANSDPIAQVGAARLNSSSKNIDNVSTAAVNTPVSILEKVFGKCESGPEKSDNTRPKKKATRKCTKETEVKSQLLMKTENIKNSPTTTQIDIKERKKDCNITTISCITNQNTVKAVDDFDKERLDKKRHAILNRTINHRLYYPPIPLRYVSAQQPLKKNDTQHEPIINAKMLESNTNITNDSKVVSQSVNRNAQAKLLDNKIEVIKESLNNINDINNTIFAYNNDSCAPNNDAVIDNSTNDFVDFELELKSSKILKNNSKCDETSSISKDNNKKVVKKQKQKSNKVKNSETCEQTKINEKDGAAASTPTGKRVILSATYPKIPKIDVDFLQSSLPNTADGVEIVSVTAIKSNPANRHVKSVKIKVSDGKCYKATVSSNKDLNMEAFLHNDILSKSISRLSNNKKYTLNVTQTADFDKSSSFTKVLIKERPEPHTIARVVDTIDLLSDDDEQCATRKIVTEFGTFTVRDIFDDEIFLKHQSRLALNCKVVLERYNKKLCQRSGSMNPINKKGVDKNAIDHPFTRGLKVKSEKPPEGNTTSIDPIVISDSDEDDVAIIELDYKLTQKCVVEIIRCDNIANRLMSNKKCVVKLSKFDAPLNACGRTSPVMEAFDVMTSLQTRRPVNITCKCVDTEKLNNCEAEWYHSKQIYSMYWNMFDITENNHVNVQNDILVKDVDIETEEVGRAISPINLLYPSELIVEEIPTLSSLVLDVVNHAPLNVVERTINCRVKNLRKKRKLAQSLYSMKTVKRTLVCLERDKLTVNTDNHINECNLKRKLEAETESNKSPKKNHCDRLASVTEVCVNEIQVKENNLNPNEDSVLEEINNDSSETQDLNLQYKDEGTPCIYTYGYYERYYNTNLVIETASNVPSILSEEDNIENICNQYQVFESQTKSTAIDNCDYTNIDNGAAILSETAHNHDLLDTVLYKNGGSDEIKNEISLLTKANSETNLTSHDFVEGFIDQNENITTLHDKDESHAIKETKSNIIELEMVKVSEVKDESVLIDTKDDKVDTKEPKMNCTDNVNNDYKYLYASEELTEDSDFGLFDNSPKEESVMDLLDNANYSNNDKLMKRSFDKQNELFSTILTDIDAEKHDEKLVIDNESVQNVIGASDTTEKFTSESIAFFEVDDVQSFVEITTDGLNESTSDDEQITLNETLTTPSAAESTDYINKDVSIDDEDLINSYRDIKNNYQSKVIEDDSVINDPKEIKVSPQMKTIEEQKGTNLTGVEFTLVNSGTCYILVPYSKNDAELDSTKSSEDNKYCKSDVHLDINDDKNNKATDEIRKNDIKKLLDTKYNNHLTGAKPVVKLHNIFSKKVDKNVFTDLNSQHLDKKIFNFVRPSKTYTIKPIKRLKRKLDMSDLKIYGKRYRKNKNIDAFKQAFADSIKQTSYKNEFKRFMDYHNTMKFSYSVQVHDDFIEVEDVLRDWPIKSTLEDLDNLSDVYDSSTLFVDNEDSEIDVFNRTLLDDINEIISDDDNTLQPQALDLNFSKGFGEGSGRVLQDKISSSLELTAAALSDVKHIQPCVVSDENKKDDCNAQQDRISIWEKHFAFLEMRAKVKSFFEKSFRELEYSCLKNKHPKSNELLHDIPGLYDTSFMIPYRGQQRVQVVQVGELPVSAGAQNPISCDSRISQVNDASPSQCTEQITPKTEIDENVQTSMTPSKEYTELTTVVAQDLLRSDNATRFANLTTGQSISMSIQFEEDFNAAFDSEIRKEIKQEIKSELDEDPSILPPPEPSILPDIKTKIKEEPQDPDEYNLQRIESNSANENIYEEQKDDPNNDYYRKFNYYYSNSADMNATSADPRSPVQTQHECFDKPQREFETESFHHSSYNYLKHEQEHHQMLQLSNYQSDTSQSLEQSQVQHGSEQSYQEIRYQSEPSPSEMLQQRERIPTQQQYQNEVNYQHEFQPEPEALSQQHYHSKLHCQPEQFSHNLDHSEQESQSKSTSPAHPQTEEHHLTVFKSQQQFSHHLDRINQVTEMELSSPTHQETESSLQPNMMSLSELRSQSESQCRPEPTYHSKLQCHPEQFSHQAEHAQEIQADPESSTHQKPELHYQPEMQHMTNHNHPMISETQQELQYQSEMEIQNEQHRPVPTNSQQELHYQPEMQPQCKQLHEIEQKMNYQPETQSQSKEHQAVEIQPEPQRKLEMNSRIITEHQSGSETVQELQHPPVSESTSELDSQSVPQCQQKPQVYQQPSSQEFDQQPRSQANLEPVYTMDVQHPSKESNTPKIESEVKKDQIAHAMNAAGIKAADNREETNTRIPENRLDQNGHSGKIETNNTFYKQAAINTVSIQQALAQILPPSLNTENQHPTTHVTPQVLHILQGKHASGKQITLVDNTHQQGVINPTNPTQVLHIVQNKPIVTSSSVGQHVQPNSFAGISLVDSGGLQGNQLLHIVNTGQNQKCPNTGQLLKRVNLLTNLTNMQGANDQKMLQFVCKSADGKSIQLNTAPQRGMVLRLQPIDTSAVHTVTTKVDTMSNTPVTSTDSVNNQESKINTGFGENYGKFPQTVPSTGEQATSLPKFNQAFGKPVFEEGQKHDEINNDAHIHNTQPEVQNNNSAQNINLEQIGQISNPALLLRKTTQSQPQTNLVQQIKQTIPIQTMHGGVIYTRQIPVNIGGGQTINLITVPSTDLVDDGQKQNNQGDAEQSIIKIVPQTPAPNAEVSPEEGNPHMVTNESSQPVLTQMRIKLPMLSKTSQIVHGARVVRPSFFQIQRNVIGGPNQPIYQQLVLTAAPQQTIRLPQPQVTRQVKVNPPDSPESQLSTSTLEQLREFDMVLEQVKERSTVQTPGPPVTPNAPSESQTPTTDTTDGPSSTTNTPTTLAQPILYSIGGSQAINVTYVNRKSNTALPSTSSSAARSPDSSGIADSPTPAPSPSRRVSETKPEGTSKPAKSKSKSKHPRLPPLPPLRVASVPPKPSSQKPLEDEQTTQRILYILAEYKEQVENCPDKNKPAPRRRTNPPINPPGAPCGKRKKSSRRQGHTRDNSPLTGEDSGRTMGSEDSSCGASQGDCNENVDIQSPQQSPRRVARKLIYDPEVNSVLTQPRPAAPRNVIVTDNQSIAMTRGAGKPTAVLMPANYILPMSMVKGGQQIAIVTNRGPKLLVGQGETPGGGAVLFQRLIGPAGLKPLLARPGVRHVRLPSSALHNIQALNLAATQLTQAEQLVQVDSPPEPQPDLSLAGEPWAEETVEVTTESSSPDAWHMQSGDPQDYSFDDSTGAPRQEAIDRTVLDSIQDRYTRDLEAQKIFDKIFDNDTKRSYIADPQEDPARVGQGYDLDGSHSDCDDRVYHQVVHKRDGAGGGLHRVTHLTSSSLRHKYAILEHELRLQKSLSEECEDLGVDSPSASELFPEADLLFANSPSHEHSNDNQQLPQSAVLHSDMDDQTSSEHILPEAKQFLEVTTENNNEVPGDGQQDLEDVNLGLEDVNMVAVSEDGMMDEEEFARSHPNTTFHSEPTDDVPYTIEEVKGRQMASNLFPNNNTVLMPPTHTVISQANTTANVQNMRYTDIDNVINSLPEANEQANLYVRDGTSRYQDTLNESRDMNLLNAIQNRSNRPNTTQVIRRVYCDNKRDSKGRWISKGAACKNYRAAQDNESEQRLFWEMNDNDRCYKPSDDATDANGHLRIDTVIKEARKHRGECSFNDALPHPPVRTYPAKRAYHAMDDGDRSLSGKTRAGESCHDLDRRRSSVRGVVKRGCHCCNGSSAPKPKKSKSRKPPPVDFHN